MTSPPPELATRLQRANQEHVLLGREALDAQTQAALVHKLAAIDFAELETLRVQATKTTDAVPANIETVPITPAAFTTMGKLPR